MDKEEFEERKTKATRTYFNLKSRLCFTNTRKTKIKKGNHKNKELVLSMLLTLPHIIRHFKDPIMFKSNVKHKNS